MFKKPSISAEAHGAEVDRVYADKQLICREGDASFEMFVILRGAVRVFKAVPDGELELAVLNKGDFFGEMSALEGLPRDATAQAVGETAVLVMSPGALLVRLRRDPTFAFELLRRLSGRVRSLNARLVAALADSKGAVTESVEPLLYRAERRAGEGGTP